MRYILFRRRLELIVLLSIFLILSSAHIMQALAQNSANWKEDFESDDWVKDWAIYSWNRGDRGGGSNHTQIDPAMEVKDGILMNENFQNWLKRTDAWRNSTLAYGTWKFDWIVTHPTFFDMVFISSTDSFDNEGRNSEEFLEWSNFTGYYMGVASDTKANVCQASSGWSQPTPGISFGSFDNISQAKHSFPSAITGSHSVEIKRTLTGYFTIKFDGEQVIEAQDNDMTTSQYLLFSVFCGDSGFDNFGVYEPGSEPKSASFGPVYLLLPAFALIMIIKKKNKIK